MKKTGERTKKTLEILPPCVSKRNVLIKPNLVEPMSPTSGAVTRPEAAGGIIDYLGENH
ncbi:MAG TPA: DUF362 domain-containing protein [Thermoplasmata archaeon]|nr:DUF362 domain-containing protein [Thermoplasmata archaeon]